MSWMIEIWMQSLPVTETKFGVVCILTFLQWNIVMDDWKLGHKSLS